MSREQRSKFLKKVATTQVIDVREKEEEMPTTLASSAITLSVDILCLAPCLGLPVASIQALTSKANKLLQTEGAITTAPGQSADARMVLSYTAKRPHLVTPKVNGGFACDSECPQYSLSRLCSHVLAAAESCNKLANFVQSLKKKKREPNLTKLATANMPKGRRQKGGKAPLKRKAKQVNIE